MPNLNAIEEASYLSVPNATQYRGIMRVFYREYEKMHYQLYKEDVLELLRRNTDFQDYTMDQLKMDLEALVRWKNLIPIQNPGKVYTIADYKNKQYQYVMSEFAVEIERLTIRLENVYLESGNLSTNLFVRIEKSLEGAEQISRKENREIYEWWSGLQEDFKRINQNYQDYLREFYSGKTSSLMKSVEFILHKDRFIQYLNEFIRELQKHSRRIARIIREVRPLVEGQLLDKVVQSELEIPHAIVEKTGNRQERIQERVTGGWHSLVNWFLDSEGRECDSQKILKITNDVIKNIIQNAAMIVQVQNWGMSRKEDYRKFLNLFLNAADLEEAHRISAHVFGVQNIGHLKENALRDTDRITGSVYEETPLSFQLKPRTHTYREKRRQQGFENKTFEKLMQRNAYLRSMQQEKELAMYYVRDGILDFAKIEDQIPENVRTIFLQWISQANMSADKTATTEYGQKYQLIRREGFCVMHCEDGDLKMPSYVLEFKDE